jgi:hypothetical protein
VLALADTAYKRRRVMVNALPSALEKYNWAQDHFKRLRGEVDAFLRPDSYRVRAESNEDDTEYRFYVEFTSPLPSARWGLIFGDGVHCLRTALDHCVYAIGAKESGEDPPPNAEVLAFPITKNADKWNGARRRVASLSTEAQAAIEGLQPHGPPDEFIMRPLGGVQELDNADKHRTIRVLAAVPEDTELLLSGLPLTRTSTSMLASGTSRTTRQSRPSNWTGRRLAWRCCPTLSLT